MAETHKCSKCNTRKPLGMLMRITRPYTTTGAVAGHQTMLSRWVCIDCRRAGEAERKAKKQESARRAAQIRFRGLKNLDSKRCRNGHLYTPQTEHRYYSSSRGRMVRECRVCRASQRARALRKRREERQSA